jgi:cytochrome c oxidase cbb3-type subunit 3
MGRKLFALSLFLALTACIQSDPFSQPSPEATTEQTSTAAATETPEQRAARLQATFPAQQREPEDPAQVAQGQGIYDVNCRGCHGQDLRGGDLGGPNLLRSNLVLADQKGEAIGPVIREGRTPAEGVAMPPLPLTDADVIAVAAYIHSVAATAQPQGAPPPGAVAELNIVVGNAENGQRFFEARCTNCHSVTGDLAGIATSIGTAENVQNSWVAGRRFGNPNANADPTRRFVKVTVSMSDGSSVSGVLGRRDDFIVSLTDDFGQYRSFSLHGNSSPSVTGVSVEDPLAAHRALLSELTDDLMHDVTAYLVTLQ